MAGVTALPDDPPRAEAEARVIRNHRRFALSEVTLDGSPVGGATIDAWQNAIGDHRWSARVLMTLGDLAPAGVLAGRLKDGQRLRGRVALIGAGPAIRPRGPGLVEWRGVSALELEATTHQP